MTINLYAAWICFLSGALAGALTGLFFHREEWLGGYTHWRRRMVRLGHIAFFGIGLLNAAFVFTADHLALTSGLELPAWLLIVGAVTMPAVCYLSAFRDRFRHLFFIPAGAVTTAIALILWRVVGT
jgi:hypothetical protein